jgi:hypothetical protein
MSINLHDIIIDRSPKEKLIRVAALRAELKTLGYAVISSTYLAGLLVQAKRIKALEEAQ